MDRENVCDLLKYPWRRAMMYSHIIHGQFVPTLTFCRTMIGCDWLNTPEEMRLQSADDGLCVSTVDYGVSLWFHLFHIHEPNGQCCIIHEQIRRSETPARKIRCDGCRAMNKKKQQKTKRTKHLKSGQVLFLFTQ